MKQVVIVLSAAFVLIFLGSLNAMADVPSSDKPIVPLQAEKGVETANDAIEQKGVSEQHRKNPSSTPQKSGIEMFYRGPLSSASEGDHGENVAQGSEKNKGQNAVEVLKKVQAKLESKVSEQSKAPEKIAAAIERKEIQSNPDVDSQNQVSQSSNISNSVPEIPNEHARVPTQGQVGLVKARDARESHGVGTSAILVKETQTISDNQGKGSEKNKNQNTIAKLEAVKARIEGLAPTAKPIQRIERNRARLIQKRS